MQKDGRNVNPPNYSPQQIIAEERLRIEIREQLEKEKRHSESKLWVFLNSSFGLFLLSSVLIAGMARLYADFHQSVEEKRVRSLEVLKLSTEFDYRLTQAEFFVRQLAKPGLSPKEIQENNTYLWRIVVGDQAFQTSLPEFKNVHWYGIVSRLKLLAVTRHSDEAFSALIALENRGRNYTLPYDQNLENEMASLRTYRDLLTVK